MAMSNGKEAIEILNERSQMYAGSFRSDDASYVRKETLAVIRNNMRHSVIVKRYMVDLERFEKMD